jgi:hypothetical protein
VYKDKFMALGIIPVDPDSAAKAFTDLKPELDKEKMPRKQLRLKSTH